VKTIDLISKMEFLKTPPEPSHYSMDGLFQDLERFLEMDEEPGAWRKFTKAVFDMEGDGRILQFRRVLDSTRRLEVTVEEIKPLSS
jgi:hypothetical protein